MASRLVCYDVCCGAGALSQGFALAGATILGGIDSDPNAIETAKANHPSGRWDATSIQELARAMHEDESHPVWKANTILAGLPCQGFSCAGSRDPDDPRNLLYRHLLQIVSASSPDCVVVENVPGLLKRRNEETLSSFLAGLREAGYDVELRLMLAADFGVPQLRKRVIVVGSRCTPARWVFESIKTNGGPPTVRQALKGLPRQKEVKRLSHVFMKHGSKVRKKLKALKPGGPFSYRRLVWDAPAPTLVAGHRALPVHPSEPRAISVREAARLQGFDDGFVFKASRSSQIEQVANAVPPPLALATARALAAAPDRDTMLHGKTYEQLQKRSCEDLKKTLEDTFVSVTRDSAREFPWRSTIEPWTILVTEMLLQRTNAELAETVWRQVTRLLPSPLMASRVDLRRLAPLVAKIGLKSRAQGLRELGKALCARHGGRVPVHHDELMRLPGVGLYMASATRAFAFSVPDFPVDSNAFRFVNRYFGLDTRGTKLEGRQIREFMLGMIPEQGIREYVYGFLDFAATICRPQSPLCKECGLRGPCVFSGMG